MKQREAVWKQPYRPRGNVREFLGRHERAMAFFGAMVVFCTFVIREGVREYLKETADSVRSSEARLDNFGLMSAIVGLSSAPGEIIEKIEALDEDRYDQNDKTDEDERKSALTKADDILDVRPFGRRQMTWLKDFSEQSPSVFGLLPMTKERKTRSEELDKYRKEMIKGFDAIPRISKAELDSKSGEDQEAAMEKIGSAYNTFNRAGERYIRLLAAANDQILTEAHKKRDRAEWWYNVSTVASYFLYTLGWGLGLVGKIYGTSAIGNEA
jgi:hypothetical protein